MFQKVFLPEIMYGTVPFGQEGRLTEGCSEKARVCFRHDGCPR